METCVLIPQEFSLCVRDENAGKKNDEPSVSVWSNTRISQGSLCYPFQGTIRLDKLQVYGQLNDDDVSKLNSLLLLLLRINIVCYCASIERFSFDSFILGTSRCFI